MKTNKVSQEYTKLNYFIRGEMKRKKLSQDSLAYTLNLTQKSISNKLSGKTDWTMWEIMNVFEILNINFNYSEGESNEV